MAGDTTSLSAAAAAAARRRGDHLLSGIRSALVQIRDVSDPDALLQAAAHLAVSRCGFDRCIAFVVEDSALLTHAVDFGDRTDWAAAVLELGQSPDGRAPLDAGRVESELARRRMAAIVPDAQNDPLTPRALVEATKTVSYVAAPVLCEGRAIGFLHADQHFKGREVDETDREALATFATGVGLAVDRAVLHQHLAQQQRRAKAIGNQIHAFASDLLRVEIAITEHHEPDGARDLAPREAVRSVLSMREVEVLELMASGASNADIARRLVVAEGTAKAHVHRIFRKLGVKNRAEAVARWMAA